jgi:hypothetical protein
MKRREFGKLIGMGALAMQAFPGVIMAGYKGGNPGALPRVPLDVCGAMLDFGNAIWAMEDPKDTIEYLGSHILCASVRDVMLWPTEVGAIFQWTAIGQGLMDFPLYAEMMARLCPDAQTRA